MFAENDDVRDFASATTIHGLPGLITNKTMAEKLAWACIMIASLCWLGYMTYKAIDEFSQYPTSLELSVQPLNDFPPINLLVQNIINQSKVESMNLTKSHVTFLMAQNPFWALTQQDADKIAGSDLKKLRQEIVEVSKSNGIPYFDLLKNLSFAWESLIGNNPTADNDHKVTVKYGSFGVFKIGVIKGKVEMFSATPRVRFGIKSLAREAPFVVKNELKSSKYSLVVGNELETSRLITVPPNTVHSLLLNPEFVSLLNRPLSPCRENGISLDECNIICWHALAECQNKCKWESPNIENACYVLNWYSRNWSDQCLSEQHLCGQKCISPCQFWQYNPQVRYQGPLLKESGSENYTNVFDIYLSHGWQALYYKEKYVYSLSSFVSNVGGLMGLCFGASMISVVHLCFFLISKPFRKKDILPREN